MADFERSRAARQDERLLEEIGSEVDLRREENKVSACLVRLGTNEWGYGDSDKVK